MQWLSRSTTGPAGISAAQHPTSRPGADDLALRLLRSSSRRLTACHHGSQGNRQSSSAQLGQSGGQALLNSTPVSPPTTVQRAATGGGKSTPARSRPASRRPSSSRRSSPWTPDPARTRGAMARLAGVVRLGNPFANRVALRGIRRSGAGFGSLCKGIRLRCPIRAGRGTIRRLVRAHRTDLEQLIPLSVPTYVPPLEQDGCRVQVTRLTSCPRQCDA
jgi:hypothetical protein